MYRTLTPRLADVSDDAPCSFRAISYSADPERADG